MMLAFYEGEWCSAKGPDAADRSCSLTVRRAAETWAKQHGFTRASHHFFRYFPGGDPSIRFFPKIRYRGCTVHPWGWHESATEPILEIYASNLDPKTYYPIHTPKTAEEFFARIRADGWHWDHYNGGLKYVHVDELEKIEGPVPDGPF